MKLQINKNKRIGRVIFFVEGDVDEPTLLKTLFLDVLGYEVVIRDKRDGVLTEFGRTNDKYSKVFVVTMPTPAICNLPGENDFMESVYRALSEHGLAHDEASVYYLFDRDYRSNTVGAVEEKISLLKNPLDNGEEMPGAILISYPCLQAYYCEAHGHDVSFEESREAKKYVNVNHLKNIDEEAMLRAATSMLNSIKQIRSKEFDVDELSDYSSLNKAIFDFEEGKRISNDRRFLTLCLLSLALLDLGIIEIKE